MNDKGKYVKNNVKNSESEEVVTYSRVDGGFIERICLVATTGNGVRKSTLVEKKFVKKK
jgi:hypothetical protein